MGDVPVTICAILLLLVITVGLVGNWSKDKGTSNEGTSNESTDGESTDDESNG